MESAGHQPVLIIVTLLISAFLSPLLYRWRKFLSGMVLLAALTGAFVTALTLLGQVARSGELSYYLGNWPPPWGIELVIDPLRVYMLLVVTGVSLWIFVYALRDLEHELHHDVIGWYYSLYALLVASMSAMTLTNDLFNLFVLMEICAISACAIITIKDKRECLEAGFKYLIMSAMGTGCFLLGVAMIYMVTGYLNFSFIQTGLAAALSEYPLNIFTAAALFIVAFGTKAALFPLHVWLPDAHASAPSPSSAMLSGLVIKIYAFALFMIFYRVFPRSLLDAIPLNEIILWLGAMGVMFGSIYAMLQTDLKKMLAYSSIGQIAFIFMGIGLDQPLALTGGLYHIMVHAFTKSMLFMSAGAIIYSTGVRRISDLAGIGRVLPIPLLAFTIGSASMIGLPGTGGLISKWYLALGALETGRIFFLLVILASSLLNAIYYMPIVINAFMSGDEFKEKVKTVPPSMQATLVVGILLVVISGIFSRQIIVLFEQALTSLY
ncbi:MAG: proton-conducting transporter membrane subunit [Bacillota bacterium]|nr:monovalent cation/H+ antiporter subunit D family protein [Bacillota bacterium]MDW7728448.1 proton-conducting transporter membrane subunit [Bacillota bacterium]